MQKPSAPVFFVSFWLYTHSSSAVLFNGSWYELNFTDSCSCTNEAGHVLVGPTGCRDLNIPKQHYECQQASPGDEYNPYICCFRRLYINKHAWKLTLVLILFCLMTFRKPFGQCIGVQQ